MASESLARVEMIPCAVSVCSSAGSIPVFKTQTVVYRQIATKEFQSLLWACVTNLSVHPLLCIARTTAFEWTSKSQVVVRRHEDHHVPFGKCESISKVECLSTNYHIYIPWCLEWMNQVHGAKKLRDLRSVWYASFVQSLL